MTDQWVPLQAPRGRLVRGPAPQHTPPGGRPPRAASCGGLRGCGRGAAAAARTAPPPTAVAGFVGAPPVEGPVGSGGEGADRHVGSAALPVRPAAPARRPRPPRLPPSAVRVPGRRARWPAGPEVAADRWAGPHPAAALARIRPRRSPCCGNRLLLLPLRSFPFSVPLPDPTCRLVRPAKRGPGGSDSHVTDVSRDSA